MEFTQFFGPYSIAFFANDSTFGMHSAVLSVFQDPANRFQRMKRNQTQQGIIRKDN